MKCHTRDRPHRLAPCHGAAGQRGPGTFPGTGGATCGCQEAPQGVCWGRVEILPHSHLRSSSCLGTALERGDLRGFPKMNLLTQVSNVVQTLRDPDGPFLQTRRWLCSWVGSSRQAVAGAASTAAFFLCEGLLGQHFDVVPNGVAEPQPGDLFLFPLASSGPGWWGAHAGVYCGDGEIIHLEGSLGTSPLGIVAKHSKSHLLRTRGPAKVLRRKGGLDAATLQRRIRAAMDQAVEYDAITCNCVHFALALLGLGQLDEA